MSKTFKNPETGDSIRFVQTMSETEGELFEVEVTYQANSTKPPAHTHPNQEEWFTVISGAITVEMNGQEQVYQAGEQFIVPRGVGHAMWNTGNRAVTMNWQTKPALRTQHLFESLWGLQQDGKLNAKKPNLMQIAVIFRAFRDEIRLSTPPEPVQTILFTILAVVGKWRGYRATYEKYSG